MGTPTKSGFQEVGKGTSKGGEARGKWAQSGTVREEQEQQGWEKETIRSGAGGKSCQIVFGSYPGRAVNKGRRISEWFSPM